MVAEFITVVSTRNELPFGLLMRTPSFWSPSLDVLMVRCVCELDEMGEDVTAFWDTCPGKWSAVHPVFAPGQIGCALALS